MAKQTIRQGMSDVKRLTGATIKDFRVWRANDNTSIIKFSVEKDKEALGLGLSDPSGMRSKQTGLK